MSVREIETAAALEPILLADAQEFLNIPTGIREAEITRAVAIARQKVESITNRTMITTTFDEYWDRFPAKGFEIINGPISSVGSIIYNDTAGAEQTLAADQYRTDLVSKVPRITEAYGVNWPSTRFETNAVRVRYVAGYGTVGADSVPAGLINAMLLLVSYWFNQHEPISFGPAPHEVPMTIDAMLDPFKLDYTIAPVLG